MSVVLLFLLGIKARYVVSKPSAWRCEMNSGSNSGSSLITWTRGGAMFVAFVRKQKVDVVVLMQLEVGIRVASIPDILALGIRQGKVGSNVWPVV
jgi:hypothetical protein